MSRGWQKGLPQLRTTRRQRREEKEQCRQPPACQRVIPRADSVFWNRVYVYWPELLANTVLLDRRGRQTRCVGV